MDLFDALRHGPQRVDDLARRWDIPIDAAERLLSAAAALGLTARRGPRRYGLGMHGAALLANPYILEMVEHHAILYADLNDPLALLRGQKGTRLGHYWPYAQGEDGSEAVSRIAGYTRIMASTNRDLADDVLDAYPVSRHRIMMDVGGGSGAFVSAVARRAPDLEIRLFDLPAVTEVARAELGRCGLEQRIHVFGGSFLSDELPPGADLISLVRIVHDHFDDAVLALLRNVYRALAGGGTLLIAEPISGIAESAKVSDAYFGFYLLAMGSGRTRTFDEIASLLKQSGFASVKLVRTRRPFLTSLIKAQKT